MEGWVMTLLYRPSGGDVNTRGPEGGGGSQVENGRVRKGSNVALKHLHPVVGREGLRPEERPEEREGPYVDSRVASIK